MNRAEIKDFIIKRISSRMELFGITERDIADDFNLVQTGLLDSMAFVDLLTDMEKEFNVEVDFEKAFENAGLTTLGGLTGIFINMSYG